MENNLDILKDSSNFSLEEKETYLTELSKELLGDSSYLGIDGKKIRKYHFSLAPDKELKHENVVEDLISIYEDLIRQQNGIQTSERMGN